jgi:hypothetical protein
MTLLAAAAVALLCVATSPARAEYEFSVFGSPYRAPDETDEVAGGGLAFDIPITSNWQVDLRGSYFEETSPDAFGEALELGDVNDEGGYYGLVELGLGNAEKANFFVEANYRRMEATVEVDPDTVSEFEGFDEDVGVDLDGLGFNIGVSFRFGA